MHATCAAHIILLDLMTLIIFDDIITYEAPHYVVFSIGKYIRKLN